MAVTASSVLTARNTGFITVTNVTLDSSYQSEGEPLTATQLGLASVDHAICFPKTLSEAEATTVGSCWYDPTKEILHVNDYKTQKEMASTKNLEKVVVTVVAFGKTRNK